MPKIMEDRFQMVVVIKLIELGQDPIVVLRGAQKAVEMRGDRSSSGAKKGLKSGRDDRGDNTSPRNP